VESFLRNSLFTALSVALCFYTIIFVNYNLVQPITALAIFVMLGLVLCFLKTPAFGFLKKQQAELDKNPNARPSVALNIDIAIRWLFAIATFLCFAYIVVQTEPTFEFLWPKLEAFNQLRSLGQRSGEETLLDTIVGGAILFLVLEATRRSIGWIVPALALLFVFHAYYAASLPDWLLPHQGMDESQIISKTALQSLGILGPAANVMFQYVFLFVVFGSFLEISGATQFIINFSERMFGRTAGGPAKVSVLGSGLMGSLSGSAVANAVTTGSFTIPMMRNSGFKAPVAGGITAAAATGGALVPPVMGAGAYMMLEFVEDVQFLDIAKAALIPAALYYFSLFMIVHFYSKKIGVESPETVASQENENSKRKISIFEGVVFFGALGALVGLLLLSFTPFKAVTGSLVLILVMTIFRKELTMDMSARFAALATFVICLVAHQFSVILESAEFLENSVIKSFIADGWENPSTGQLSFRHAFDSVLNSSFIGMLGLLVFGLIHPSWRGQITSAFKKSAGNGIALVAASACVGIIIGIVQTTPMANEFSALIKGVVESNLLLALIGIMGCSLVLGMGVPSVVCYLLMATLMGSLLGELGVQPLAAHLFIFYFGMMSMVTPPVALAAYASASIAQAPIMRTAWESFRFSLVGFTLPFMFIYRPALLFMAPIGEELIWYNVVIAVVASVAGVVALAGGLTGFLRHNVGWMMRIFLFVAAALLLAPNVGGRNIGLGINIAGIVILVVIAILNRPKNQTSAPTAASTATA